MVKHPDKILIVDDDARNVFALSAVLRSRKYQCLEAPDMAGALSVLDDRQDVGIILLDIMMPDVDGYEAIPKIKEDERAAGIPVIAVTAQAMSGDRERCLQAGANGYITKPVDVDALIELLNTYLGQRDAGNRNS